MLGTELLTGDRVRLTALAKADAAMVASWYEDAEFMRLFDAEPAFPKAAEEVEAHIEEARKSKTAYLFGLRRTSDDALVGMAELDGILWAHGVAWLGIGLGREFWDQRLGSEALALLLRYAFQELNLYRVQLTVFDYNARALALYRRSGFLEEGRFRQFLLRDGERHDMLLMGILRDEWEAAACND
jgi:RimJ/RimL family protein N-acetyltransferase